MNEKEMPSVSNGKTARIVKWALVIAIIIVLNLFFNYAISLVYKAPEFSGFCPVELTSTVYTDKAMCVSVGGQWNETTAPLPAPADGMTKPVAVNGYCDATFTCSQKFNDSQSSYNRNVFILLLVLGILSLVGGAYATHLSSVVALGFSFGGTVSILIGAIRYWSNMQDVLRVVMLGVALVALVWVGVKKIKE